MSEKVAARLRKHELQARKFFIGVLGPEAWIGDKLQTALPTNDGHEIFDLCRTILRDYWRGEGIRQVQVTALSPRPINNQLEFFMDDIYSKGHDKQISNKVMDMINQRYGEFTLAPARLLNRSSMPNVIAPAWKPFGHRQTI